MKFTCDEPLCNEKNKLQNENKNLHLSIENNHKYSTIPNIKQTHRQKRINYCTEKFFSKIHVPQKRKKSSEKERQRNLEIKAALSKLSRLMPFVQKDLSRIRTLRLAKEYIKHLKRILQGETIFCEFTGCERPLALNDFERIVHQELQTNNSYKDRADLELASSRTSSTIPNDSLSNTPSCSFLNSINTSTSLLNQTLTIPEIEFPLYFDENKQEQKNICKTNYQHFFDLQNNYNSYYKLNATIFNSTIPRLNFQH